MEQVTVNGSELAALAAQVTALTAQVAALTAQVQHLGEQTAYLTEEARARSVGRREWDELKADLTPIASDVYLVAAEELAEIEQHVRLEDLAHLLKRLARNTPNFERLLDQLESAQDFLTDFLRLSDPMVHLLMESLAQMEAKGYFGFAREGVAIADRVVTAFTEDDVRQLGDNVVLILSTVKAMTQPDIMNLAGNLTATYRQAEQDPDLRTGTLDLVRQMRDPEVRRGLALTLRVLRALAPRGGAAGASVAP